MSENTVLIFTAYSKHIFYAAVQISKFVIGQGSFFPVNPFTLSGYYLGETLQRDVERRFTRIVRDGNNRLVTRCDELWVFGKLSDGVIREVTIARSLGKKVRYWDGNPVIDAMKRIDAGYREFEEDVPQHLRKCIHAWSWNGDGTLTCTECNDQSTPRELREKFSLPGWLPAMLKDRG